MSHRKRPEVRLEEHFLAKQFEKEGEICVASIVGYVGKSESPDHVRIYQDLRFDAYVEVHNSAILRVEEVSDDELQFGGTRIWVPFETQVTLKSGREEPQTVTGEQYFKGAVADKFIEATRPLQYNWVGKKEMLMLGSSAKVCFDTCTADNDN